MGEEVVGWAAIADKVHLSENTLKKNYRRRLLDAGAIFYQTMGRPPRKQVVGDVEKCRKVIRG